MKITDIFTSLIHVCRYGFYCSTAPLRVKYFYFPCRFRLCPLSQQTADEQQYTKKTKTKFVITTPFACTCVMQYALAFVIEKGLAEDAETRGHS